MLGVPALGGDADAIRLTGDCYIIEIDHITLRDWRAARKAQSE